MTIRFGPFTLDRDTRQLRRGNREVHLSPKAFELLLALADARPNVLSKQDLQQILWPQTFVAEANLSNLIAEVREGLGDRARTPVYIRTSHGFGYAFCYAAETVAPAAKATAGRPWCWLEWGARTFPLADGEHIIGRDEDADVRLESSTVSRRHARVTVHADRVTLDDFGSKNGTFRGDERVTGTLVLVDGDALRIGSLLVTFRVRAPLTTTETVSKPTA